MSALPSELSAAEIDAAVSAALARGEDLYRLVWDASLREGDRTVDVYVHKLRSKLEAAVPEHSYIHTHVGFGYRFAPERSHAFHT